jgi:hypothetical protein
MPGARCKSSLYEADHLVESAAQGIRAARGLIAVSSAHR